MNPESGIKTWQWVVTAIVVIVLIVVGILVFGGDRSAEPVDEPGTNNNPPVTTGTNGIVMSDQYPGNVVYVSSVQLASSGWVAIHKDNGGTPGAVIGTAYVNAGVSPARVNLTEPVVDGGTYYAMLHSDNGDRRFDEATDMPLKDQNGNVIMRVFRGSASAGADIKG